MKVWTGYLKYMWYYGKTGPIDHGHRRGNFPTKSIENIFNKIITKMSPLCKRYASNFMSHLEHQIDKASKEPPHIIL